VARKQVVTFRESEPLVIYTKFTRPALHCAPCDPCLWNQLCCLFHFLRRIL